MPDEQAAVEREGESGREMDLIERRLWHGGLIAALVFIGIAILVAGPHRRKVVVIAQPQGWGMQMTPGFGPPPPPPWGGPGEYYWRGWGLAPARETPTVQLLTVPRVSNRLRRLDLQETRPLGRRSSRPGETHAYPIAVGPAIANAVVPTTTGFAELRT